MNIKEKLKKVFHIKYFMTGIVMYWYLNAMINPIINTSYKEEFVSFIVDIDAPNFVNYFITSILIVYAMGWIFRGFLLDIIWGKNTCSHNTKTLKNMDFYIHSKEDYAIYKCKKCGELVEVWIGYPN